MAWEKVKLGEIASFSNGVNFGKDAYAKGVKLIGVSNFGDRVVPDYNELEEISASVLRESDYLKDGDIVFVRSNGNKELVGRCMLIDKPQCAVTYSGFCIRARFLDKKIHCPKFFNYYFKTAFFRKSISGAAVGANIQNLNQGILSNHVANVPDFEEQKRISDILSAYDNLIENNQKQIKLLEEAAQRLYKQWFIDLKFPGHETTKIENNLPAGWKDGCVGDIAVFKRGKVITKNQTTEGSVPVVSGGLEPACYHNESNTSAPVITVSGSGANAGFTRLYSEDVFASDCSYADINTTPFVYFIYSVLKNKKAELDSLQKGAAQPHVYAKDVNALKLTIPSNDVLRDYTRLITPIFEKIKILDNQIKNSIQARDRLLPKLMCGEIEV